MTQSRSTLEHIARIGQKLERELGEQILACLRDPEVIEIMLNPNGVLWVERFGHPMARLGEMPPHQAEAAMATIAAMHRTTITRDAPILECELPIDGSRFEGLIPPVVIGPSFCIRKRATKIFTLSDYVAAQTMTSKQKSITEISALQLRPKESARAFLERTILPMLRTLETSRWASVIRIVITEGEHFPALAATYRRLVLDPATAMIRDFASRAVSNGEMQSNALIQFPLMLVAPAVVATLWNGLFGAEDPMDAAAAFEAFLDLAFPSSDVIKAESG